ncbi:hypothetical protein [Fibrobacter sp.]|uniref:hypothetical protein n=1 Tax=Fibrobacter sp. TaxID=35828 RepID=UPI0025BA6F59|nr:hypothetical protein [Fibrobacter sp.]MBR4006678.1 hypothetical protein [Fibrobacter sp.]
MASLYDLYNQPFDHYHRYFARIYGGFLNDFSEYKHNVLFDEETNLIKVEVFKEDEDNVLTLFIQADEQQNIPRDEWLALVQLIRAIEKR